jgi:hypothetical protein
LSRQPRASVTKSGLWDRGTFRIQNFNEAKEIPVRGPILTDPGSDWRGSQKRCLTRGVACRNGMRKRLLRIDRLLARHSHLKHGGLERSDEVRDGQADDTQLQNQLVRRGRCLSPVAGQQVYGPPMVFGPSTTSCGSDPRDGCRAGRSVPVVEREPERDLPRAAKSRAFGLRSAEG